ncbi:hypothetical protein Ga0061067_105184 [Pannonibacter indicus]|uniref:Uncharacterized protein n=1 Tax=Pannonibacter indicus TaxID=466044 RepID=A0A0K6HZP7_9HYPH|nr:hypothetical protein Ga0061067_105184 [Pannonibacter indicus]
MKILAGASEGWVARFLFELERARAGCGLHRLMRLVQAVCL